MDNQGFIGGNSNINGVKHAVGVAPSGSAGFVSGKQARIAMNDVVGISHTQSKPDGDPADKKIDGLRKFQSRTDRLFMAELVGMAGGWAFGGISQKLNKSKFNTVVKAIFVAPLEALRKTTLGTITQLPAHYMESLAQHADNAALYGAKKSIELANKGKTAEVIAEKIAKTDFKTFDYANTRGTGAKQWAIGAEKRAASLEASGKKLSADIGKATAPVMEPIKTGVRDGLNSLEKTGAGKGILRGAEKFANWRMERQLAKHTTHLEKAQLALTTEMPGFLDKIGKFFTGKKPEVYGAHDALKEVTSHLNNAQGATSHAARASHMGEAKAALIKLSSTGDATLKPRMSALLEAVEKSHGAATGVHALESAQGRGLVGLTKAIGQAAGRLPLFGAIIGVGAVAGVTASLLTHKKESRVAKQAQNEIAAVIGHSNPLMQSIEKAYGGEKFKRAGKTGFAIVGDVANAAMAATPGGGGMAMMGAVMLPMAGTMLIKENTLLNAYANLRQEENTGKKLPPEQKLEMISQLVASVPSVSAHGGYYNRLTKPVAEALMDKNLSAVETMKLLANEQAFSAMATEVQQAQKAAVESKATPPVAIANDNKVGAEKLPVPMISGAKPSISAASISHEGRVTERQVAASV